MGEELALINPLLKYSSKYFYSTKSLFQDILYKGPNLKYFPFSSTILQLYSWCSANLSASFYKNTIRCLWYFTSTFITGLVCFFSTKAFSISVIVIAKIVYLSFLASRASKIVLIIQISKVLNKLWLFTVFYLF